MSTLALSVDTAQDFGVTTLVRIAKLSLFLPQNDIVAIEARGSVDTGAPSPRSVGWLVYEQRRWPVYCLSEDLSLLFQVPAGRRACVLLARDDGYVAVLCDEIRTSQEAAGPIHTLPDAMRLPDTPVVAVVTTDSGIACFSDGCRLAKHVERMVTR